MNKRFLTFLTITIIVMAAFAPITQAESDTTDSEPEYTVIEALLVLDFERDLYGTTDEYGVDLGDIPWGDTDGNVVLRSVVVEPGDDLALPDQVDANTVLGMDYDIRDWGGYTYAFHEDDRWISQDWSEYDAIRFWLYGANTGASIRIEFMDNRRMNLDMDVAERFAIYISDDYEGWKQFTIPFNDFVRRGDWQPAGAPDDGLQLAAVWGISLGLPQGVGATTAYFDQFELVKLDGAETELAPLPEVTEPEPEVVETDYPIDGEWTLVWSDEFDGDAGDPINPEYWTCEVGGWGWGNNEHEYYTNRTENAALDGEGNLVITAIKENLAGSSCWYGACKYTSARCITQNKVAFTYGKIEARIQIPYGQGIWPAFWMLGANFAEVGWPNSGEVDILENIGREPNVIHGTVHGPGYSGGSGIGGFYNVGRNGDPFADDFHVYGIEWEPGVIRWYMDGTEFYRLHSNRVRGNDWVFDHDFFLLLNLAVGGNWPGYPDDTTTFPQTMTVDWVRWSQRQGQ